ncbi:DEAD/DEAH box helicase family protein [Alcanivorax sp.]|uniref:DEAD/DEAH box helicase n=1 Tax=Alcanivorax sp. TaxID=1872427 RepID=UPI0025C5DC98|nr:DEAD/DEAH box helicase family protein [Alcanivorax sp.]
MDLIGPLEKVITLPEKLAPTIKVGGNNVQRVLSKLLILTVELTESECRGLYKLNTRLDPPLHEVYLKAWNTRAQIPDNIYCLKFKYATSLEGLNQDTELVWFQYPGLDTLLSRNEVTASWLGQLAFKEDKPELGQVGLRLPQIGALHAISAHLSTDKELEPATVVLPTGTGKTETMLATMVYRRAPCILLVVPSRSLREQISTKFLSLGCLPSLGVVSPGCNFPYVAKITTSIQSVEEAERLVAAANVIVTTPNVLQKKEHSAAVDALCQQCSHLFVDEAHHVSAKSWAAIRERFVGKPVIQFTATPFRNDHEALGGRIVFNYTMGEAQRAGYFKTVHLNPIEEFYEDKADQKIAKEAIALLRRDIEAGFDHLMMARVSSKSRANNLIGLYRELAPELQPIVVHSEFSQARNKQCLELLNVRQSRIVICVDMLGEGYDLPNLKVAALHDHHKSLAITLQFIGRFTRSAHELPIGDASAVVNIADPGVGKGLDRLYSQGADWDVVLRRLAENQIEREIQLQDVVDALKSGEGDLSSQISLWNLTPSYSTVLFETHCDSWNPDLYGEDFPSFDDHWHAIAKDENILVVLAVQRSKVKWGNYKELNDIEYKLLIAYWDQERGALFVFSNDYKCFRVEKLARSICGENCEIVSGDKVFNVFNGVEVPLVRNLGASQVGAISFAQFFGSNVTEGLDQIEKSKSKLSNAAVKGYENGEAVIWGCSEKKGKVWSPQASGSLSDWREWVKQTWDKIAEGGIDEENITRDFLRPERISELYPEYSVSVQWGEQIQHVYEDRVNIQFGDELVPFYLVDLSLDRTGGRDGIFIRISSNDQMSVYQLSIFDEAPGYSYQLVEGLPLRVHKGNAEPLDFNDYMERDPVVIQYVDGCFSYNRFLVRVKDAVGLYPADNIVAWDWRDIDIRSESMGYENKADSIQYRSFEKFRDDYNVIINDDGSGEAADLVAFKVIDDEIVLSLIHCKYSSGDAAGARVSDLYEVCGQAQRSIHWKHAGMEKFYRHLARREKLWDEKGQSRFLKGTMSDLSTIKNRARTSKLRLEVAIVQPGLSVEKINEELLRLLGCTASYIKKTTQADLLVIASR